MSDLGKALIVVGLVVAALGLLFLLFGDARFPLGRLPGDFAWRKKGVSIYFPLATSLVISILLTLLLNLFFRHK